MEPRVARLVGLVQLASECLASHGANEWAELFAKSADEMRRGDAHGLERLMGAFGYMGDVTTIVSLPGFGLLHDRIRPLAEELWREENA